MDILVLTADPLPLAGLPATGAGLRAWALAEGLNSAGLAARAVMPASILAGRADASRPPFADHVYPDDSPGAFVRRCQPRAVVLQHWGMLRRIGEIDAPLAMDLAGPHLLERRHWGHEDLSADRDEKLRALRRADFVVCSGQWQRLYFLPWLMMAGFDGGDPALCPAIPFCWSPDGPPPRARDVGAGDEMVFVSGGVLLPWQDPLPSIRILLEEMERAVRGRLVFCGGAHPSMNVAGGESQRLLAALEGHARVELRGLMPLDEWLGLLGRCDVAFDLLPHNNEREIAFPTRTAMYLWSGLPVVHGDYDELGGWIRQRGAGWAVDPGDELALRQTLRRILEGRADMAGAALAARELGRSRLDWSAAIAPLAEFCRSPFRRTPAGVGQEEAAADTPAIVSLQRDLALAQSDIAALRGKWPMRLARAAKKAVWLATPILYPVVAAVLLITAAGFKLADLTAPRAS